MKGIKLICSFFNAFWELTERSIDVKNSPAYFHSKSQEDAQSLRLEIGRKACLAPIT